MDWKKINSVIIASQRILLTSHENPDGDGLGSASAMYYYLKELVKDCRIINVSPLPTEFAFLNKDDIFEYYKPDEHNIWLKECDLVIIFDVGDYKRLRVIKDAIEAMNIDTMNIDHHPCPKDHPFTYNVVDTKAAATGVMIYDYLKTVRKQELTKEICEGIYTAILTDTGSFRHSNTDKKCHEIAIACLEAGVNTSQVYQNVYESKPQSRIRLLARVIDNLTIENNGELAWFTIDQSMLDHTNATPTDVDGFTDFIRTIKGVEVAVMIFENGSETCRINFRSKGKYVINSIAKSLGGGGHKFAAGAIIEGKKNNVALTVIKETKSSLKKQAKSV